VWATTGWRPLVYSTRWREIVTFALPSFLNNSDGATIQSQSSATWKAASFALKSISIMHFLTGVYKYFSGFGKLFLNTSQASPALEKTGKYLYTPFRISIYEHFSGAGEVFIYTFLAPDIIILRSKDRCRIHISQWVSVDFLLVQCGVISGVAFVIFWIILRQTSAWSHVEILLLLVTQMVFCAQRK